MKENTDKELDFVLRHYDERRFDGRQAYERFARLHRPTPPRLRWHLWAVAASLVILLASGAYWWFALRLTTLTAHGDVTSYLLADGTKVVLSPGSTVSWKGTYRRHLQLAGRAYFEVIHDSSKPFSVSNAYSRVTDLGTRFMVAEEQGLTRVLVSEGSVAFGAAAKRQVVRLGEGMEAVLFNGASWPRKVEKAHPNAMSWATRRFHFDHTPLPEVLSDLEHHYGVSLRADRLDKSLTGDFNADSLITLLPVIEKALGVRLVEEVEAAEPR